MHTASRRPSIAWQPHQCLPTQPMHLDPSAAQPPRIDAPQAIEHHGDDARALWDYHCTRTGHLDWGSAAWLREGGGVVLSEHLSALSIGSVGRGAHWAPASTRCASPAHVGGVGAYRVGL